MEAELFNLNSRQKEREHHTASVSIIQSTNFSSKQNKNNLLDEKLPLE
jgi:hypothetical protein